MSLDLANINLNPKAELSSNAIAVDFEPSRNSKVDAFELHPLPAGFTERSRRPSTLHADAFVSKDLLHLRTLSAHDGGKRSSETIRPSPSLLNLEASINANSSNVASTTGLATPLTKQQKRNSLIQFLALCWCAWLIGWNDGSLGPLLPRIQNNYGLGYTIVSMLFIGNCAGYVTGSALNIWLNDRYGLGKILVGAALCQLGGYVILISSPPFGLIIVAYTMLGFGLSMQSAQANGFIGSLQQHMTLKLGMLHGAYGFGAFTSPFAATYFSTLSSRKWAFHFILSAAFSVSNILVLIYVFRFKRQEEILLEAGQEPRAESMTIQPGGSTYKQILKLKAMPLLAAFALIYIGVEVTLGGWIVTFIIRERHGGPSAGYISSGFFGGLTAGRVCLIWINEKIGGRRVIFIYSIIAIGLELTIWFVPSIIGNAIAVSLIGVVLGPMFPLLVSHMTRILPYWLLTGCVGLVTGIGFAGSAALPFITGLLASKYGIGSLQPLMVSMMSCMLFVWALVPSATTRVD